MSLNDLTTIDTETLATLRNGSSEFVDAQELNTIISSLSATINSIISQLKLSVPEVDVAKTYTALQTFSSGIDTTTILTDKIDEKTSAGGILLQETGTGDVYINTKTAANKVLVETEIDQKIADAGSFSYVLSIAATQTGNFNAASGLLYPVDLSSGAITATLPASPSNGAVIGFKDINNSAASNNLTIGRNGEDIERVSEDGVLSINGFIIYLMYNSSDSTWEVV